MPSFDAIVIGTGQAGPYVAKRLAGAGMRVAVVERSLFGGTCVNTGCIPTKAMVASAYAARLARRGAEYGVETGDVRVDMTRVRARTQAIVVKNRDGVERGLAKNPNVTIFRGHARFESPRKVRVGEEVLESERIYVNVGGRATVPDMPGLAGIPHWNNSSVMGVDFVPRHLVVVGGSYIGLEFGQMFRRFGSEVTIVEMMPRLAAREDEDVSGEIRGILEREGIDVRVGAKCIGFRMEGGSILATAECADGAGGPIAGSHVLLAVGRRPNTDDLGREIVVANLLEKDRRRVSDRITTYALFTDPPLGRAGMTEAAVRASGRRALVAKRLMKDVGRAVEKGETDGFMKIAVDADSKEILGSAILGTGGDEVIHVILDVMYAKAPYTTIQRAMHIHPTVAELLPTLLGALKPLGPA